MDLERILCIRPLQNDEIMLLPHFLYEAIYVPAGDPLPSYSVVNEPALRVYTENFGASVHDLAFVADISGAIEGMVWSRIMNDYGHIDEDTPSLAIAVHRSYRGRGVGTALLLAMLQCLRSRGYAKVSLSVHRRNPAVRLYQKIGFQIWAEKQEAYIMYLSLVE